MEERICKCSKTLALVVPRRHWYAMIRFAPVSQCLRVNHHGCFASSKVRFCPALEYMQYTVCIYIYMYQKYIKTTGNIYCKTIVSYTFIYSVFINNWMSSTRTRRIDPPEPPLGMSRFLPLFLGLCHKVACRAYCKYAMRISKLMSGHVMKMWIAGLSEHLKIKELIGMFWAVSLDMEKKQHNSFG